VGFDHLAISLFILASVSGFSLWLIQRNQLILPSILLPLSALLVLTSNLIVGGSLQESGSLVYTVVIVYTSLLLGKRAAILFAVLSILSQTFVFLACSNGWVTEAVGIQKDLPSLIVTSLLISIMTAILWIMLDSLERSIQQTQLSEARWRSLVENAPVMIVNTDRDGTIQFLNHIDGKRVENAIGKSILEFVPTIDQKRAMVISRQVLRSGKSAQFEASGRDFDGTDTHFNVSVGPIWGSNGKINGLTYIVLDITDKKRVEHEIIHLNAELEVLVQERTTQLEISNQELASLSYSVSHNLRTPLRAIDGFSLVLLEDYQDVLDELGQDYLKRVRVASQRMGILIDDLLRLASFSRREIQTQLVNLSAFAQRIADDLRLAYPERAVDIRIENDMKVVGDENLLYVAMSNLFSNAWAFTGQREDARIEFGRQEIDGKTTYFIRDNGVGFDMQYMAKLFQPFQHLHGRSELEGSGIGLAIVQRIIQKHGGTIWAEARENQGATFYFTLSPR
jgi:PAS domain S-box-containing protein